MTLPTLWMLAFVAQVRAEGPYVGPAEFARLMEGLHGDVRDVSFVFEGWFRGVPPGRSIEDDIKAGRGHRVGEAEYQGGYSFRADGATRLDCYRHHSGNGKEYRTYDVRQLAVILREKLSQVSQFPDLRNEQPSGGAGGPGVLNLTSSPERIHYSWLFQTLKDPAARGYEFLGWEEVGGHRCLKFQFDEVWGLPNRMVDRPMIRFWIDMERGGHPLRIEFRRGEQVRMRTQDIELERVPGPDGRERWFPIRGITYLFPLPGPRYEARPVGYETYSVIQGTVRFNQGLPDAFFTLDWKGTVPENESLATRRKEFRKPPRRYDPQGIKRHLREALAEADQQSKHLEAPSVAREPWNWTVVGQAGFAALGVATLLGAGIWRWRRR